MAIALTVLAPHAVALVVAVALDFAIGDPVYPLHPVRLMGRTLAGIERVLRAAGADGYAGGVILFVLLAAIWAGGLSWALVAAAAASARVGWALHVFVLYSLIALGDLLRHGRRVERGIERGDLAAAKAAVSNLVGRDTGPMDAAACRRAAVESLSESLADGFTSPLFWYLTLGLPGLIVFKVASTMDSMVGYKTPRYLTFGWCGARTDDLLNFVPARLTWIGLAATASMIPGCSARKAWRVGLAQHAVLPGPNAGWSEAATAGGIQRRLVGPIWREGVRVTDLWIGDPADPPLETAADFARAVRLVTAAGVAAAAVGAAALLVTGRAGWAGPW